MAPLPRTIAFLDVETTGLHSNDRIVALAFILLDASELAESSRHFRFAHLIFDPGKKCHPAAAAVHGYDDWTLRHQAFLAEEAQSVRDFLHEADLLVAHNAAFDCGFVNRELQAAGLPPLAVPTFCTMQEYRARHAGRASLKAVAARIGMARCGERHGAFEDAWLAMNIYLWLHGRPGPVPFSVVPPERRAPHNFRPPPPTPEGDLPPRK